MACHWQTSRSSTRRSSLETESRESLLALSRLAGLRYSPSSASVVHLSQGRPAKLAPPYAHPHDLVRFRANHLARRFEEINRQVHLLSDPPKKTRGEKKKTWASFCRPLLDTVDLIRRSPTPRPGSYPYHYLILPFSGGPNPPEKKSHRHADRWRRDPSLMQELKCNNHPNIFYGPIPSRALRAASTSSLESPARPTNTRTPKTKHPPLLSALAAVPFSALAASPLIRVRYRGPSAADS